MILEVRRLGGVIRNSIPAQDDRTGGNVDGAAVTRPVWNIHYAGLPANGRIPRKIWAAKEAVRDVGRAAGDVEGAPKAFPPTWPWLELPVAELPQNTVAFSTVREPLDQTPPPAASCVLRG